MRIVPERLSHIISRNLYHLGMGGAELGGGAFAIGLLREVVGVVLEVFVGRQDLPGGMHIHAVVIHAAALFLGDRGGGRVGAVAEGPDRVERAGVERVADLEPRLVAAGHRGDHQAVGPGKPDGIVGVEAAAEVFLQQGIDRVHNAAGRAAGEDDLAADHANGVALVA